MHVFHMSSQSQIGFHTGLVLQAAAADFSLCYLQTLGKYGLGVIYMNQPAIVIRPSIPYV